MTTATMLATKSPLVALTMPNRLEAAAPPEVTGAGRDDVKLMVAGPNGLTHRPFTDFPSVLDPGDLLVVNVSATLPASVPFDGGLALHLSTTLETGIRIVEIRRIAGPASVPLGEDPPSSIRLPGGGRAELLVPYPVGSPSRRLWAASLDLPEPEPSYLDRWGRPIRYRYVSDPWPLDAYQTIFSRTPGSAEMPSAGRPFTEDLVVDLISRGVNLAPITLHTGVSSLESHEDPYPEWFEVPEATARLVNQTRDAGGRVVAVGTTAVRAIESSADEAGRAQARRRWTDLVVSPERGIRLVDGLLTGWHEPASTHLAMLAAVAGCDLINASYEEALREGYRWHEFGDSHLILGAG